MRWETLQPVVLRVGYLSSEIPERCEEPGSSKALRQEYSGVGTPQELAAFEVRTAVAMARLDEGLGPEDETFRSLVINELTADVPYPYDSHALLDQLTQADNPMTALGEALALSYTSAASQACSMILDEAVAHLFRCGGEAAVQEFLADLEACTEE